MDGGTYTERRADGEAVGGEMEESRRIRATAVARSLGIGGGVDLICSFRIREASRGNIPPCDMNLKRTCKYSSVRI